MRPLQMCQRDPAYRDTTYHVLGHPAEATLKIAMVTLIVMSLGLEIGGVAFAQGAPPVPADRHSSDPRFRAPIGARQPRPQDLPPQVLSNEGQVRPSQRDFDSSLQICRGC